MVREGVAVEVAVEVAGEGVVREVAGEVKEVKAEAGQAEAEVEAAVLLRLRALPRALVALVVVPPLRTAAMPLQAMQALNREQSSRDG